MEYSLESFAAQCLEEADTRGYLIYPRRSSEAVVQAWIRRCGERNRPCVYALPQDGLCEVTLTTDTMVWLEYLDGPEELQELFDRYAQSTSTSRIDINGCTFTGMSVYAAKRLCEAILEIAESNWYYPN